MGHGSRKRAFTLIELLIAISIFAVVAVALSSTFFAGVSVWKRSAEGGNIYHDIRFAFDDITKDLNNIIYCSKDMESLYSFSGMAGEIVLMRLEDVSSEEDISRKELVKVTYEFDSQKGVLIRARADISTGFDVNSEKEVVLKGIEDFKFEYCYDSGDEDNPYIWKEVWESEEAKVPRGVRVTSVLKADRGEEKLKFSKIIIVPVGVLGEEL